MHQRQIDLEKQRRMVWNPKVRMGAFIRGDLDRVVGKEKGKRKDHCIVLSKK